MLSDRHEFDEYWRLNDYGRFCKTALLGMLGLDGREVPYNSIKALVLKQQLRDRGCLAYDHKAMSEGELLRFIQNRGLEVPKITKRGADSKKKTYIEVLEAADATQVFARFTHLPPELRERIYKLYLNGFQEKLKFPTQPPLARTCRLLRQEVLPLFYTSTTFELYFAFMKVNQGTLQPCLETTICLETLPTNIRKFDMKLDVTRRWSRRREDLQPGGAKECSSVATELAGDAIFLSYYETKTTLNESVKTETSRVLEGICSGRERKSLGTKEIAMLRKLQLKRLQAGRFYLFDDSAQHH